MVTFIGACVALGGILLEPVAVELVEVLRLVDEVTLASVVDVVFTDSTLVVF